MKVFSSSQGVISASTYVGGSQAGYEAINLASTAIRIPWRSTDTAQDHGVELTLGAPTAIHAVLIHSMNEACTLVTNQLELVHAAGHFDAIPNIPIVIDPYSRRKALYAPHDNGYTDTDYDRIRFRLISSASVGSFFRIGSIYVFGTGLSVDVIRNPAYGSGLEHIEPTIVTELVNGARSVVNAGPAYDILQLDFDALRTGSSTETEPERLWRDLAGGDVGIDLENEDYQFWPMRLEENRVRTSYTSYNWDSVALSLREIVTV